MQERRKFVRLDLNTLVEWKKIDNNSMAGQFSSKNISAGGICLIVDNSIAISDKLILKISLPNTKVIQAKGKVVWIEGFEIVGGRREKSYEAGIEFFEISEEDRQQLNNFVLKSIA